MKRLALVALVAAVLLSLVTFGLVPVRDVGAARPYEGTTIRAVVNAEYVKYSLSLVEKDLYDKLGIKIETEVIPADAFVAKTLLEFNGGQSPWDLVMFGPSNMPDYGRHFEPLEPWIQKLKLEFYLDDIADVYKKLMLRHNGKMVSMPYDGDVHILFWNKTAFERPDNRSKFKAKYGYDLAAPEDVETVGRPGRVLQRLGLGRLQQQALWGRCLVQAERERLLVLLVAAALLRLRGPVLRPGDETAHQHGGWSPRPGGDGSHHAVLPAGRPPLRVGGTQDDAGQGRDPASLLLDEHRQAGGEREGVPHRRQGGFWYCSRRRDRWQDHPPTGHHARPGHGGLQVLRQERSHHEGAGVHLPARPEPEDRDGPQDDHGPLACLAFPLGEVPQGLPGCR